ncbi:MAG TPA: hypothetical protein VII69_06400 [Candidatus Eremiobacteraceae bacterium]
MVSRPPGDRESARLTSLPIVIGPIVLALCWTTLGLVAQAQHASCWDGFKLARVAGPLALDYKFNDNVGPALPLLTYAMQAVSAYVLLFVFGVVAAQRSARAILVAISLIGTIVVSLFFCAAYVATYADLARGGFLCDLGFELIPFGGFALAVIVVAAGWLIGWLAGRRPTKAAGR